MGLEKRVGCSAYSYAAVWVWVNGRLWGAGGGQLMSDSKGISRQTAGTAFLKTTPSASASPLPSLPR